MRSAAKKAGTVKRWSSSRCSPSGKRSAVPLQQRAAEQLVRGQEPERRVGRGEAVAVDGD